MNEFIRRSGAGLLALKTDFKFDTDHQEFIAELTFVTPDGSISLGLDERMLIAMATDIANTAILLANKNTVLDKETEGRQN